MIKLPEKLNDPVAIIQEDSKTGLSIIVFVEMQINKKRAIAPLYVDGTSYFNNTQFDVNVVKSVHGRKNATRQFKTAIINHSLGQNTLFYINKNKANPLLADARVTMPKKLKTSDGFILSIRDNDSKVKPKLNSTLYSV